MSADREARAVRSLAGHGILVTRPEPQARALLALVEERGGHALAFALLSIAPVDDADAARRALERALETDLVIFVSANAVAHACALEPGLGQRLCQRKVAAIGAATARALTEIGVARPIVASSGSTSEALLGTPALSERELRGRGVGIVKGRGGRTLLAERLGARGALVRSAEVYRRLGPRHDFDQFLAAHGDEVELAIVTSAEALEHLVRSTPVCWRSRVLRWALVLPSERVVEIARSLGFVGALGAVERMCDAALLDAAAALLERR